MKQVIKKGWNVAMISTWPTCDNPVRSISFARRRPCLPSPLSTSDRATIFTPVGQVAFAAHEFAGVLALSVGDHQAKGDLAGAWQDLMGMFRMARQWSGAVPVQVAYSALVSSARL